MFKSGETPIPGYQLVRFLGRGAYGEVWESHAPGGTRVALKFVALQSSAGSIELKSANAVKLIRHANLIPINAIWLLDLEGNVLDDEALERLDLEIRSKDTITPDVLKFKQSLAYLVIAMALADDSLDSKLTQYRESGEQGIPTAVLIEYIREAAKGLDFLNEPRHQVDGKQIGIVHRDIKPANLLLLGDAVVVGDFGMATSLKEFDDKATVLGGSLGFMAPESIARQPTRGSDQYSLAITYYYLRTGQTPYDETQTFDSLVQVHKEGRLEFGLVSDSERAVLRKATSVLPTDRYPSCADFVRAISNATEPGANPVSQDSSSLLWIGGAAAALAAVAMIWYFGFYRPPEPNPVDPNPVVTKPVPQQHNLALTPSDVEFAVAIIRPESEEQVDGKTAIGNLSLDLFRTDQIKISSKTNSNYWLPFEKTFTYQELAEANWAISLEHKSPEEFRKEAFQLAAQKEFARASQMLVDASRYESNILEMPAPVEREEDLEVLKLVSGEENGNFLLHAMNDANQSLLRLSRRVVADNQTQEWIPSPTELVLHVVHLAEQDSWLIFDSNRIVTISNQGNEESNWPSEDELSLESVAVSERNRIVAAGDLFGNVHVWQISMDGLENYEFFEAHDELVVNIMLDDSVNEFFAWSTDGTMRRFSISSDAKVVKGDSFIADGVKGKELLGAVLTAGSKIVMATEEGELFVASTKQPSVTRSFSLSNGNGSARLLWSSVNSPWVLLGTNSTPKPAVFINVSGEEIVEAPIENVGTSLAAATFSKDGNTIAFSTHIGELFLVDLRGEKPMAQLISKSDRGYRKHLGFSGNGERLVSVLETEKGDVEEIWDIIACQVVLAARSQVPSGVKSN